MREWFAVDPMVALAILVMGMGSALPRLSGLLLVKTARPGPLLESWLKHVPTAMFAALCAPALVRGGVAEWAAAAVVLLVARMGANLAVTLVLAAATVAGVRVLGF
jgi:uncharacterized membrane protein